MTAKQNQREAIYSRAAMRTGEIRKSGFVYCPVPMASPWPVSAIEAIYRWAYAKALIQTHFAALSQPQFDPSWN